MKIFRGCRYEVRISPGVGLWSRHSSFDAAGRSYREAVNNRRGDHTPGALVEFVDVGTGSSVVLSQAAVRA
jgi:hypothetical protein